MKTLKDEIYNAILHAARHEFIHSGFKDASMRNIAKEANVGLSNIYNYFSNKNEIYLAIVEPAKNKIFTFITRQHTEETFYINRISMFGHERGVIDQYIDLIDTYKEELRLLLFHSEGSSLHNFREDFTDHLTQISYEYMELENKYFPESKPISRFFIHVMSSWMVSVLGEIVTHKLSKQKIRDFFEEYFRFEYAGWCELTGT